MDVQAALFEKADKKYAEFHSKLIPTVKEETIIGVRVPTLRKFAKELAKNSQTGDFLEKLPHKFYDENMLHAIMISDIKDYSICIEKINEFLPYVDNWAVCDCMSPKVFKAHKSELLTEIKNWIKSKDIYTCRYGLGMLMRYFLDENFKTEYTELAASVKSDEYYINMMIAWFFATALAKQWDTAIEYLHGMRLDKWVHNKTISKAYESYRISDDKKKYLKTLKR